MRILWSSPLPPTKSGVADYAVELLPELAKLASVRVRRPPGWQVPDGWPAEIGIVPTDAVAERGEISLIHLGNNPYHLWVTELARPQNVVAVLHDAVLHHLLVEATEARGDHEGYRHDLRWAHGDAGSAIADARAQGISGRLDPFLFPARRRFLDRIDTIVVHSRWAESTIRTEIPDARIARVGLAVVDPGTVDRRTERQRLGLKPENVVLMHLGFLTPEKGLSEILAGMAAARRCGVDVKLVIVGEGTETAAFDTAARAVGVAEHVVASGWLDPARLPSVPAAADLGVALRTPSAGETSAAAVRFLACGTPVAVGGVRQFLEWPEAAAPRLTPGPSAPAELARLLGSVVGADWPSRGEEARRVYESSHRPDRVARDLVSFLEAAMMS
jgi:glycosyltransferase involved in cell wall biosynthesis